MSGRITLEVAVTTAEEARLAVEAGADRLELGSALELGGITPSPGTFECVRAAVPRTPIYVLLRPRPGDFAYSDSEFATILQDAAWFLRNGANGIVCGVLDAVGRIDLASSLDLVHTSQGKVVFHRAFDFLVPSPTNLEELIQAGFERVLSSGGAATALAGADRIAELQQQARGRIEVLPGGGVNAENVIELIHRTDCKQVHGAFRKNKSHDRSELERQMGIRSATDGNRVRAVRAKLEEHQRGRCSGRGA